MRTRCQDHSPEGRSASRPGEVADRGRLDGHNWFDRALIDDAFAFHFQPIVDVRGDRVHGHECLVRLPSPDKLYMGGEIVEAAIHRHRLHVFDAYCRQKAIETAAPLAATGTKIFINFLPSSIYDPSYCLQSTLTALRRTELRPSDVVFEVVQSELVQRLTHLLTIRDFCRDQGLGFALDNLGTGSDTLALVKQFRPEYIKIDKSVTPSVRTNFQQIAKLQEIATWWGAKVIAEGVEESEWADELQRAGIDLMQGWLFGRPAPEMVEGPAIFADRALAVS
jgi:EAL domain-containing protein (putative c-di-GMP-specific phosphodiesterase class I)